jgi:hypothetical protein
MKKIRSMYPNAYEKWSASDDDLLKQKFLSGASIAELSKHFQRQTGGIRSRLRKLGLAFVGESPNNEFAKDDVHYLGTNFQFHWVTIFCEREKEYFFPEPITAYMLDNYRYPSVYRWIVYEGKREQIKFAYIGTTKQLCPERLEGYLYPDTSSTNLRLHHDFRKFIEQGYQIGLESLLVEQVKMNNVDVKLNNLHSQTARTFLETLVISYYRQNGLTLLNQ